MPQTLSRTVSAPLYIKEFKAPLRPSPRPEEYKESPLPETYVDEGDEGSEGVYLCSTSNVSKKIIGACPSIQTWDSWYKPPWWLRQGDAATVTQLVVREVPSVEYDHYQIPTIDGGYLDISVALEAEGRMSPATDGTTPLVLIIPGGDGNCEEPHTKSLAAALLERGLCAAALAMRGCDSPVHTPRYFSFCRGGTDDVRTAIRYVREGLFGGGERGQRALVFVVGWCVGGSIVSNMLAEQATAKGRGHSGRWTLANGGVALGAPHDLTFSIEHIEGSPWRRQAYSKVIAKQMLDTIAVGRHLFEQGPVMQWPDTGSMVDVDFEEVLSSQHLRQMDEALTRKVFGYDSVDDYYYDASPSRRLPFVNVPLLLVSASDDPIIGESMPVEAVRKNPHLIAVYTKHGGHISWLDAEDHRRSHWVEGVIGEFLSAVVLVQGQ